ncbi:MAG TPA: tetratricopeptide repeat protein, partial [Pseudonocardiaceae bacterium]|nr:tetratricopeptide repeat protein [Pseudonocardiaceae bacterium]
MVGHRWLLASHRAGRGAARSALALPPVLAVVDADRRLRGPYTAVGALLRAIVPDALATVPELVIRHNVEILATTPELRRTVPATRDTLTSLAVPEERTRFYSRLRTLRITHGLIEFLVDYLRVADRGVRTLVVDNAHEADPTDREFVAVLLRRMDSALLTVVVTTGTEPLVDPPGPIAVPLAPALMRYCERIDAGDPHTPAYTSGLAQAYVDSDGTCDDAADVEAYQRLSAEVRARLRDDRAAVLTARDEPSLLIGAVPYHREHGSDPAAGPRALHHAQDWCMDHGYYHAVVDLGLRGLALTDEDTDVDEWWAFTTRMTTALAALGRPDEALALYDEVRTRTTAAGVHMQAAYATAMLYTRQFEGDRRDHQRARAWINQAVGIASILPDAKQRAFNTAFNRNGLALIEFHQGKPDAALSLLDECIADLAKALAPGEQVLHRSVLRYNRAQVYAALGRLADAVEDYSAVIEQDPNYAEYYFDRAAIYRRLGRHAEARADYD